MSTCAVLCLGALFIFVDGHYGAKYFVLAGKVAQKLISQLPTYQGRFHEFTNAMLRATGALSYGSFMKAFSDCSEPLPELLQEGMAAGSHHEVLGVAPSADAAAVRRAYRRAAAACHPDRLSGAAVTVDTPADKERAAATFLRVQQAYDVLGDGARRAHYEASLAT